MSWESLVFENQPACQGDINIIRGTMCFTKKTNICSRYDFRRNRVWSVPVVLVQCPLLLLVFLGCVGCQRLLQRLVKWLFAIAHGTSFRFIARPPGLYLFHSGSCGHLPQGVCPHATLMTTSTSKPQWTVAYTVAFGRCCKSTRPRILLWEPRFLTSTHLE